jgi:hypothetical protein
MDRGTEALITDTKDQKKNKKMKKDKRIKSVRTRKNIVTAVK